MVSHNQKSDCCQVGLRNVDYLVTWVLAKCEYLIYFYLLVIQNFFQVRYTMDYILIAIFTVTIILKTFNIYSFVFFKIQLFKLQLLLNNVNYLKFLRFDFVVWIYQLDLVFEINEKFLIDPHLLSRISLIDINIQTLDMNFRNQLFLNLITFVCDKLLTILHLRIINQMHVLIFADHHKQNSLLFHFFIGEIAQKYYFLRILAINFIFFYFVVQRLF